MKDPRRIPKFVWTVRSRRLDKASYPPGLAAIYVIENTINRRLYIGQTTCLNNRIQTHRSYLKTGTHRNTDLQIDYHRFGPEWFQVRVLEFVPDPAELEDKEAKWLTQFPAARLYNTEFELERAKGRRRRRRVSQYVQGSIFEFADDDVAP
ncbi:GIY-YIG nuclease family protein [Staphylospora marina]|uniref:GIY-YIG nuclease family protein n=1 Tax=Staphylospora marina TaxID=2490858 RepID=UPI0013DE18CC|nr:GIY-YIG nuclease family protein [Staphylospora marina]